MVQLSTWHQSFLQWDIKVSWDLCKDIIALCTITKNRWTPHVAKFAVSSRTLYERDVFCIWKNRWNQRQTWPKRFLSFKYNKKRQCFIRGVKTNLRNVVFGLKFNKTVKMLHGEIRSSDFTMQHFHGEIRSSDFQYLSSHAIRKHITT